MTPTSKEAALLEASAALGVACMRPDNVRFLLEQLRAHPGWASVLEVGTGCGYSAYMISRVASVSSITTLDRDPQRLSKARELLADEPKILVVDADAAEYVPGHRFDVVVLDGPKLRVWGLFERFLAFVSPGGGVFVDNLWLNDLRRQNLPRHAKLLAAADDLVARLKALDPDRYRVTVDAGGDGMALVEINPKAKGAKECV